MLPASKHGPSETRPRWGQHSARQLGVAPVGYRPARSYQQSTGTRGPRATHLSGRSRTTVTTTSPNPDRFSSTTAAIKIAGRHTSCLQAF